MAKAMQPQKMRFSQAIQTPLYKNLVNNTLGDPVRAGRFIANITSAVAVNAELQKCDPGTILAGALLGESLFLQPSPQLGQFYLVPFKSKAKYDREGRLVEPEKLKAQFVLGYRGYIQLALRTGQYKRLNVLEVKNGELSGWDPFEERFHEMHFIEDFEKRMSMPTIGYIAHFEYINGRMIEIYAVTALGPIPLATLGNAEWRGMGQNYLKSLLALGFQAFLIMVVVGIYAVLIQQIGTADDISGAIWGCMGYTVLLCFCLFKTGSISKAVFTAH